MTHDPYCPRNATTPPERETVYVVKRVQTPQCACEFIARVRADQDAKSRADERDRIRTELLALASERAGVAGRNTDLTGYFRRYLIDLTSVLDVVNGGGA